MTYPFPYKTMDGETLKVNNTIINMGEATDIFENITVLNNATIGNNLNVSNTTTANILNATSVNSAAVVSNSIRTGNAVFATAPDTTSFTTLGSNPTDGPNNTRIIVSGFQRNANPGGIEYIASASGSHSFSGGSGPGQIIAGKVSLSGAGTAFAVTNNATVGGSLTAGNVATQTVTADRFTTGETSGLFRTAANTTDFTLVGSNTADGANNTRIVVSGFQRVANPGGIEYIASASGQHSFSRIGGPATITTGNLQASGSISAPNIIASNSLQAGSLTLTNIGTALTVVSNADIQGTLGAGSTSLSTLFVANQVVMKQKIRIGFASPPYILLDNFNDSGQDWIVINMTENSTIPTFNTVPSVNIQILSQDQTKMYTAQIYLVTEQAFYFRIYWKILNGTTGGIEPANSGPSISWTAVAE